MGDGAVPEAPGVRPDGLKDVLLGQAERLKQHARQLALRHGRPLLDFAEWVRKDEKAREIAERSGIKDGLVCILSTLEPCYTLALRRNDDAWVRRRGGRRVTVRVALRKSVVSLFRDREIALQSNARDLSALARVDDPTEGVRALNSLTTRKNTAARRPVNPFHPLSRPEPQLSAALTRGEHALHGVTNREVRQALDPSAFSPHDNSGACDAQISRLLHRLHVDRLVAKIFRSRRRRVTDFSWRVMSTALELRHRTFPEDLAAAA